MTYLSDTTRRNVQEFFYLKGDADTNGSLRALPDVIDGTNFELQLRSNGVWNDTGIQIAAATIYLGRDLELKGAGDWLLTTDVNNDIEALVPHIEFSDAAGTNLYGDMPILAPLVEREIMQPDDSVDNVALDHDYSHSHTSEVLIKDIHVKVGATAATADVEVTMFRDEDDTGTVFWRRNYPASDFPANTEVEIFIEGLAEMFEGIPVFFELKSDIAFSLLGDAGGDFWMAMSNFPTSEESIMTSSTGMERVLIDDIGMVIADKDGNLVLDGVSP